MFAFAGLIGALRLEVAVYVSVGMVFVAGGLLCGVWRGGSSQLTRRLRRSPSLADAEGDSLLCVAEVEVDAETQLTVRSWWPSSLEISEVRANGTRVAMENAERWFAANRGFSLPEISFEDIHLDHICSVGNHSTSVACGDRQCAVCFDEISDSESCTLRLCGHCVHRDCLSAWFKTSRRVTCPMCRCDHSSLLPAETQQQKSLPVHNLRVLQVRVHRAVLPPSTETATPGLQN
jgi:hypothetical protein